MAGEQIVATLKANPISVACGALTLALAIAIYFRSDRVPLADAKLNERASLGERIDANLKNGVQLAEQTNALTVARQQIEARLIRPDELAKNLQFFYKLEADTGTKLIDLRQNSNTPKAPKPKASYINVGYAVTVRGDYARLIDFLHRLESRQRFCRILSASVAVTGSSPTERANELTLNLALELLGQP